MGKEAIFTLLIFYCKKLQKFYFLRSKFPIAGHCSKIKTHVLPTFLIQKMFDIELNTQFCPKNVDRTHVLFINKRLAVFYVLFE